MDSPEITTVILIGIVTMFIIPLMGRGTRLIYYILNSIIKIGIALIISSIIVGVLKENRYIKLFSSALNNLISSVGFSDGENIRVEIPEHAKVTARSILKDGVIKLLNYI